MISSNVKLITAQAGPTSRSDVLDDKVNLWLRGNQDKVEILNIQYAAVDLGPIKSPNEHTVQYSCFIWFRPKGE